MNIKNKSIIELYPELADKNNERRFIEFLHPDLQVFVDKCYEHCGKGINNYINEVCELLLDYLVRKGHIDPQTHRHSLVDCLVLAALLHDTYFEGPEKPSTLFKAREEFLPIARQADLYEHGAIPDQITDAMFQAIEEQMGDASEIQKMAPVPGSPADLLAISIWITRRSLK